MTTPLVNLRIAYGSKSRPISSDDLATIEAPPRTETFVPIKHIDLLNRVKGHMVSAGLEIVQESHVLWRNGLRFFSLLQISHPSLQSKEQAMIVGIRNSADKSLPASILASNQVFLCDNLVMVAEQILSRKHTKGVLGDLDGVIQGAVSALFKHWKSHLARVDAYKAFDLVDSQAHDLIARAFLLGAIGKTQVAETIEQWHSPNHPDFKDRNLWNLHNAFTEVWKGRLDLLPANSAVIHREFDKVAGFLPATVPAT